MRLPPLPDGQRYEHDPGPWRDSDGLWFELGGQTYGPFASDDDAEENFVIVQHVLACVRRLEAALATAVAERQRWESRAESLLDFQSALMATLALIYQRLSSHSEPWAIEIFNELGAALTTGKTAAASTGEASEGEG